MKNNLLKKVMVGFMAAVMVAGTFMGKVTVNASSIVEPSETPVVGSLTINKKEADGTTPLAGAGFTIYKIMDLTPGQTAGEYADYTVVPAYESAFAGITPNVLGNYSAAEIEAKVNEVLALTAGDTAGAKVMPLTDAAGQTSLADLPLGYYIVVETTAPEGYVAGSPFFVAIPSTNNYNDGETATAGTSWVYEIEVEPKNAPVPLEKKIVTGQDTEGKNILENTDTTAIGQDVDFRLATTVPNFAAEYFKDGQTPIFRLKDTMSAGLTFNNDITVYSVAVDGTETLVPATNYAISLTETGFDFVITFNREYLLNNGGTSLAIYYSAEVNSEAVLGTVVPANDNKVILDYSNNPQDVSNVGNIDDMTRVFTFGLKLEKYTGTDEMLEGAEFALYFDAEATKPVFDGNLITGADGLINFGDKGSLDEGVYYLKEIKSPAGYKLLTNPIKIEIVGERGEDGELNGEFTLLVDGTEIAESTVSLITRKDLATGITTIAVENQKGFTLPATGGMGVAIFLVIGIGGLVVLSIVMMKKKSKYTK